MDERDALRAYVARCGSQKAAAEKLGLSGAYVSDILHGYRKCSPRVLQLMGFRRKTTLVRTRKARQLIGTK